MSLKLNPQCCCTPGCETLAQCVSGKSPEVTIAGIPNSICPNCVNLNSTYLFAGFSQSVGPLACCYRYVMTPSQPFMCAQFPFLNRLIVQFTASTNGQFASIKVMASAKWQFINCFWMKWELSGGLAIAAFTSLCDGQEERIPFAGWYASTANPDLVESCFLAQLPPTPTTGVCDTSNESCIISMV